jgi:MFS family permease
MVANERVGLWKARTERSGAIVVLSLCTLLGSLSVSIGNVALPELAVAFSASFQAIQWVVLAFLVASTGLIVSVGKLGDILGRRALLILGLAVFACASLLCAVAPSLGLLLAGRAAQGVGAAAMTALALALAAKSPAGGKTTGKAMGLIATMSAIGTALGPSAGGALIEAFGWHSIFLINVPLALIAIAGAVRYIPAERGEPKADRQFDYAGTVLLFVAVTALCLATALRHASPAMTAALMIAAALALGLFVRVQRSSRAPLIALSQLGDRGLSTGLALTMLVSMVMMGFLVVGPFYLTGVYGLDLAQAGLALSAGPLTVVVFGIPAGRLADWPGPRRMTAAGLAIVAAGCLLLANVPRSLGVAGFVASFVFLTLGYAVFQTANNAALLGQSNAAGRGTVSGLISLCRNLGLILGASVIGAVFSAACGADIARADAGALANGMRVTFVSCAAIVALALMATVKLSSDRLRPVLLSRSW